MTSPEKVDIRSQGVSELDRVVHEPARLMILMYLYALESADFVFLLRATELTDLAVDMGSGYMGYLTTPPRMIGPPRNARLTTAAVFGHVVELLVHYHEEIER